MKIRPITASISLCLSTQVFALPPRVNHVPSGNQLGCQTCHFSPQGGAVNSFGYDVSMNLVNGQAQWEQVCQLDSDLDGYTNGVELGDADCVWRIGAGDAPDQNAIISYPGDPNSLPIAPPDLGIDMELPDLTLDMEIPLDVAVPDQELWDAWLNRPDLEDGFSINTPDLMRLQEDFALIDQSFEDRDAQASDLEPMFDSEVIITPMIDMTLDQEPSSEGGNQDDPQGAQDSIPQSGDPLLAGEMVAGIESVNGGEVLQIGEVKQNANEEALPDQLSGCQTQVKPSQALEFLFMIFLIWGTHTSMKRRHHF